MIILQLPEERLHFIEYGVLAGSGLPRPHFRPEGRMGLWGRLFIGNPDWDGG
jgi:hypothetical protein